MAHGSIDNDEAHPDEDKKPLSTTGIAIITLGLLAVEFEWSTLYVFANPLLRQLGTSHVLVGLAWCASPFSIFFGQPILGVLSDRCEHRWGRRKPFLVASALAAMLAMTMVPNSEAIASYLLPVDMQHSGAIFIAMFGVMLLDLTNELVYYFIRALLVDMLPSHQSEKGNSMSSFMMSIGGLMGNSVASRNLLPYFPLFTSNANICFLIGQIIFVSILGAEFFVVNEKPYKRRSLSHDTSVKEAVAEVFSFMRKMPHGLYQLCLADFFSWVGLFTFFMYSTEWMGENVYHGSPTNQDPLLVEKYEAGVREGAIDLALTSVVSFMFAPFLPKIIKHVGLKNTYMYAHVILAVSLLSAAYIQTPISAILISCVVGVPFSVDETIPYVYISHFSGDRNTGLYLAVLQNFAVAAKLFVSVGMGYLVTLFNNDISAAMGFGGVSSVIACFIIRQMPNYDIRPERIAAALEAA